MIFFFTFQYICYPWKNDDQIDPKNRRKTCRQDDDCDPGQECFRHHDKRMVNRGLCFDEVRFYYHCATTDPKIIGWVNFIVKL